MRYSCDMVLGIAAADNVPLTTARSLRAACLLRPDLADPVVESVKLMQRKTAPACVGDSAGVSRLILNRNIIDPETRRRWEGPNHEGPSSKTVTATEFATLGGYPIAVQYDCAMPAVAVDQFDQISGVAPGMA